MSMEKGNACAKVVSVEPELFTSEPQPSTLAGRLHEVPVDFAGLTNPRFFPVEDILAKHHFLKQMEREKLRTDRSSAPLSVVLFRLENGETDRFGCVEALLRVLHQSKRETDFLGCLSEDLVALLLPDTDEAGARGFLRKIEEQIERFHASTKSGTYPDVLFDQLLREPRDTHRHPFFFVRNLRCLNESGYRLKRALDIAGAIAGILLLSPLMLLTAIAVALDSPGPIFFRQTRVGKGGATFGFYKFRSMFVNADDRIHREFVTKLIRGKLDEVNQGDAENPHYKIKADPRVTRVGHFIRRTSIDELPQLFNVLKGDMSLVGPRPPLPYEVENYASWHLTRILEVTPGITGLWQVEGHSSTTFDDMVRLDLQYIRKCSFSIDLRILFKTVRVRFLRG
jgi:lipopolysaccharide/colanic/teichoic acid biosynthesis glycosyltransferase